jgi:putative ABC transport system substrate-binding protein
MRRREFITALGGTLASWPLSARPQELLMPVIGLLHVAAPGPFTDLAFVLGLKRSGYIEGQNVLLEHRWARSVYDRLPKLATELVKLRVNVMVTFGTAAAHSTKIASISEIPATSVVFSIGSDPIADGLVASLGQPGGNMTGVTSIARGLAPRRLELAREFLRANTVAAILINPDDSASEAERTSAEVASAAIGQRLEVLTASNERDIEIVFAALSQRQIGAVVVGIDTFLVSQMKKIAMLAALFGTPVIGPLREFAAEGCVMSYGTSTFDTDREAGVYAGRVLKGERPADLPVLQPTSFDITINITTARELGIRIPANLLALADEVIE